MRKVFVFSLLALMTILLVGCTDPARLRQQPKAASADSVEEEILSVNEEGAIPVSGSDEDGEYKIIAISSEGNYENHNKGILLFYEDSENYCAFPTYRMPTVYYESGESESVTAALEAGRICLDDLDRFGIDYLVEPKP